MDSKKTGQFIQKLRKQKKLTQSELADLLKVTDKAISRWETGEGFPEVSMLPHLSSVLGITVDELLLGDYIQIQQGTHRSAYEKFKFLSHISTLIILFGYLIAVTFQYSFSNRYWSLLPFIMFLLTATVIFLYARYHFFSVVTYDEQDKIFMLKKTWRFIKVIIITVLLLTPQFLFTIDVEVFNQMLTLNAVLKFSSYILVSIFITSICLGIDFFAQKIYFTHRKNPCAKTLFSQLIIIVGIFVLMLLILLLMPISVSSNQFSIYYIGYLLYLVIQIGILIYLKIKKWTFAVFHVLYFLLITGSIFLSNYIVYYIKNNFSMDYRILALFYSYTIIYFVSYAILLKKSLKQLENHLQKSLFNRLFFSSAFLIFILLFVPVIYFFSFYVLYIIIGFIVCISWFIIELRHKINKYQT